MAVRLSSAMSSGSLFLWHRGVGSWWILEGVSDDGPAIVGAVAGEFPLGHIEPLCSEKAANQGEARDCPHDVTLEIPVDLAVILQRDAVVGRGDCLVFCKLDGAG